MSEISALGLKGILSGLSQAASAADDLTKAFEPDSDKDPLAAIVSLSQAEHQVAASSKVIKVDKELTDAILDILA